MTHHNQTQAQRIAIFLTGARWSLSQAKVYPADKVFARKCLAWARAARLGA